LIEARVRGSFSANASRGRFSKCIVGGYNRIFAAAEAAA